MNIKNNNISLVSVSALVLFLELCLIRWLPAHIYSVAFFANLVLIASMLGLGLGMLLKDRISLFKFFPIILLVVLMIVVLLENLDIKMPAQSEAWLWSSYTGNRMNEIIPIKFSIISILSFIYILIALCFIPLGQQVSKLLKDFSSLHGYSLNLLGSILGVAGFSLLSVFGSPSYIWFIITGILYLLCIRKKLSIHALIFGIILVIIIIFDSGIIWSPYYSLKIKQKEKSTSIYVNQLLHQKMVDFDNDSNTLKKYSIPYKYFNPNELLIIGAGSGNDVAVANNNKVKHIDAVDIDSTIYKLGKKLHPQHPYSNKNINMYINDARGYMTSCNKKYDMIIFGTVDSHANLAFTSSVRLDNYIYTVESLKQAKKLLSKNGVLVIMFSMNYHWLAYKLFAITEQAFGNANTRYAAFNSNHLFNLMIIAGPGIKKAMFSNSDFRNVFEPIPAKIMIDYPTDNWPYLYLANKSIPTFYLKIIGILVLLSSISLLILTPLKKIRENTKFLFLGAGFMLLETKSITTFSLFFGSTWVTNSIVFLAILTAALLSNLLIIRLKQRKINPNILFYILFSLLGFLYLVPIQIFLPLSIVFKIAISLLLIGLPVYLSSIIFSVLLSKVKHTESALGCNILGAVLGGFSEYLSIITGLNFLYILALLFYFLAFKLKK